MAEAFFDESTEQSQIKAKIVSEYFFVWAKVITQVQRSNRIAYIDLFAGPGRYKDGTMSTPLMVLDRAIRDSVIAQRLVTLFNDLDSDATQSLENAIKTLPGIDKLKHGPRVMNQEIGTEIVKRFEEMRLVPTLFFVDPWGYKGLSLKLVNAVVKDWACECVFSSTIIGSIRGSGMQRCDNTWTLYSATRPMSCESNWRDSIQSSGS
jgi:three-Cys-motif partner protein